MKKLVLIAVFLLGLSMMAMAQDTPAVELFGGYSFVDVDTATAFDAPDGYNLNLNGWNASVAINANRWAAFVAEFGGYYGSPSDVENVDVSIHSIMFGPRISLRKGMITPFFQGLFGYGRVNGEERNQNVLTENDFAMAFGGGLDINVSNMIAIRPVQLDYFTVKAGTTGDFSDNLRYSAGIVLKLGKR